jgi:hypothetical protein
MALLPKGGRLGVVDTENSSASVYAGQSNPDGGVFDFDVIDLSQEQGKYSVTNYVRAWEAFEKAGYAVILTDSITHAWAGEGGVLYVVDKAKGTEKNDFAAWRKGTPEQQRFIDKMMNVKAHHIVTMRSKMEYVLEENSRGQKAPRKVGMSPVQRDGVEYEFDVGFEVDTDHILTVSKTRLTFLDGHREPNAGANVGRKLLEWYTSAAPAAPAAIPEPAPPYNRDGLRRAFFRLWGEVFPAPTLKQGLSRDECETISLKHEALRCECLMAWVGVPSINGLSDDRAKSFEEFLRTKTIEQFKAAVDKVVGQ